MVRVLRVRLNTTYEVSETTLSSYYAFAGQTNQQDKGLMMKDISLEKIKALKAEGLDDREIVAYAILELSDSVENIANSISGTDKSLVAVLDWSLGQLGHDNIPAAIRGDRP